MDERTVRDQLAEVKARLRKNEEETKILLDLVHGLEGWLRINGFSDGAQTRLNIQPIEPNGYQPKGPQPKGTISFRKAINQVLDEAHGAPLHVKEIGKRILDLGVVTETKNLPAVVDLTCRGIEGAEKVGPRTWRKVA